MATNFLQFSFFVPLKTQEERAWLTEFLTDRPVGFWTLDQIENEEDESERTPGFAFEFDEEGVVIYAEENGDTEHVTHVLMRFLGDSKTKLSQIGFTYSTTCSKMRPGEFSGGAVTVRWAAVAYIDAGEWLATQGGTR